MMHDYLVFMSGMICGVILMGLLAFHAVSKAFTRAPLSNLMLEIRGENDDE